MVSAPCHSQLPADKKISRIMQSTRPQVELEEWELEAGRALATDSAGQEAFSIDTRSEASVNAFTPPHHNADEVTSAASSADIASPHALIQSPHRTPCPNCGAGADRVRRRTRDRLVSLIIPVRRYRCSMKGWDCAWEGNLRKHYW
jgi:hypothetical protein